MSKIELPMKMSLDRISHSSLLTQLPLVRKENKVLQDKHLTVKECRSAPKLWKPYKVKLPMPSRSVWQESKEVLMLHQQVASLNKPKLICNNFTRWWMVWHKSKLCKLSNSNKLLLWLFKDHLKQQGVLQPLMCKLNSRSWCTICNSNKPLNSNSLTSSSSIWEVE